MVLAEIPDNAIFILVMLAIAGFKTLAEKFGQKSQDDVYQEYDENDSVETDYEEYTRQLRERQAEIIARQQGVEPAPPPLPVSIPAAPQQAQQPEPKPYKPPVVKKPQLTAAEKQALENLQRDSTSPRYKRRKPGYAATARARALRVLSNPHAARDAIVLSEILGPPKSQRW